MVDLMILRICLSEFCLLALSWPVLTLETGFMCHLKVKFWGHTCSHCKVIVGTFFFSAVKEKIES